MASTGTLTDEMARKALDPGPTTTERFVRHGMELLEVAKQHREASPAVELMVLGLLQHPNAHVRSEAIDTLRSWSVLKHPQAVRELQALKPKLSGYALNAATEVLANLSLAPEDRPKVEPRPWRVTSDLATIQLDNSPIFLRLLDDLFVEAETFDMSEMQKQTLRELRETVWVSDDVSRFAPLDNFRWGQRNLPVATPQAVPQDPITVDRHATESITAANANVSPDYLHSMPDFAKYLKDRVGPELIRQVQAGEVDISVYAGSVENLIAEQKLDPRTTRRLPSPYAEWGIDKYVSFAGEKPKVHFVIPPIREYAEHYDVMLRNIGSQNHEVRLNLHDREVFRNGFSKAVDDIYSKLGDKLPEIVVMGYDYAIPDILKSRPEWRILSEREVVADCANCGVRGKVIEIQHSVVDSKPIRLLLVASDKTLWGEGSVFLAESLLRKNPSMTDLWFMGSAGSPGMKNIYGVSVPDFFMDRNQSMLFLDNAFNFQHSATKPESEDWSRGKGHWKVQDYEERERNMRRPSKGGKKKRLDGLSDEDTVLVVTHTTHGRSVSPAEQTRDQVSDTYTTAGVHTVDVETHLLAELINRWNLENPHQRILFGAGHVITDIPASRNNTFDTGISLSDVDKQRKRNAREVVITRAFDTLEQRLLSEKWQNGENPPVTVNQHFGAAGHRVFLSLPAPYDKHEGCGGTLADMSQMAAEGRMPRQKIDTPKVKIKIGNQELATDFDSVRISTPVP